MNDWALGAAASDTVREWVRGNRCGASEVATGSSTLEATLESSTAAESTAEASASTAEAASAALLEAAAIAALEASTTAKAAAETASATTVTSSSATSVTILTDFEKATLPIVSVHDVDSVLSVLGSVEGDNTGSLGGSVRSHVNVSTNDISGLTKEILQVLPANREWELQSPENLASVRNHVAKGPL